MHAFRFVSGICFTVPGALAVRPLKSMIVKDGGEKLDISQIDRIVAWAKLQAVGIATRVEELKESTALTKNKNRTKQNRTAV